MDTNNKLIPIDDLLTLMVAGNFTFTLNSKKSDDYYTYNIKLVDESEYFDWLVTVLDKHTNKFVEIGSLEFDQVFNFLTKDNKFQTIATRAFQYLMHVIKSSFQGLHIEARSVGKCCRCGRRLITVESIEKMIGPECEKEHKDFINEIINQTK